MRVAPSATPLLAPALAERLREVVEVERAGDGAGGMVRLLAGRAEQHVQRVADDLGHRAVMREDDVGHADEIVVEQRARARSARSSRPAW